MQSRNSTFSDATEWAHTFHISKKKLNLGIYKNRRTSFETYM